MPCCRNSARRRREQSASARVSSGRQVAFHLKSILKSKRSMRGGCQKGGYQNHLVPTSSNAKAGNGWICVWSGRWVPESFTLFSFRWCSAGRHQERACRPTDNRPRPLPEAVARDRANQPKAPGSASGQANGANYSRVDSSCAPSWTPWQSRSVLSSRRGQPHGQPHPRQQTDCPRDNTVLSHGTVPRGAVCQATWHCPLSP